MTDQIRHRYLAFSLQCEIFGHITALSVTPFSVMLGDIISIDYYMVYLQCKCHPTATFYSHVAFWRANCIHAWKPVFWKGNLATPLEYRRTTHLFPLDWFSPTRSSTTTQHQFMVTGAQGTQINGQMTETRILQTSTVLCKRYSVQP